MKVTAILITLFVCLTLLAREYIHDCAAVQLKEMEQRQSAPILQLIPIPGSDESEPDRPDVWREEFHRKGRGAALNGNEESSLSLPVLSPPRPLR